MHLGGSARLRARQLGQTVVSASSRLSRLDNRTDSVGHTSVETTGCVRHTSYGDEPKLPLARLSAPCVALFASHAPRRAPRSAATRPRVRLANLDERPQGRILELTETLAPEIALVRRGGSRGGGGEEGVHPHVFALERRLADVAARERGRERDGEERGRDRLRLQLELQRRDAREPQRGQCCFAQPLAVEQRAVELQLGADILLRQRLEKRLVVQLAAVGALDRAAARDGELDRVRRAPAALAVGAVEHVGVRRRERAEVVGGCVELVLGGVVAGLEAVARLLRLERGVDAVLELLDGLDCRLVHSCVPFWVGLSAVALA